MIRGPSPDEMCALCDEFSVKNAEPEIAALGMGRCMLRSEASQLNLHVGWNSRTCVSFRLDLVNIAARRQYVQVQKLNEEKA